MKTLAFAFSIVLTGLLLAGSYSGTASATAAPAAAGPALDGKAIFLAQKCNVCHSISSAAIVATVKSDKMKGPDLTGLAPKLEAKLLDGYLRKKVDINGKKHSKSFTGTDAEMAVLIAWLQKQEK